MESLQNVAAGFAVVLEPTNLLYCLVGVVIGMLIGVLPGLGPAATIEPTYAAFAATGIA